MRSMRVKWSIIDPLEFMFLIFIGLGSLAQLVGSTQPSSIGALLPVGFRMVWLAVIFLGCVIGVVGLLWTRDLVTAALMEKIGLNSVAVGLFIFGAASMTYVITTGAPLGSLSGGSLPVLLALGFAVKAHRIQRAVNELKG